MERLEILNQTLMRGLLSYCRVFGGRAHFSDSPPPSWHCSKKCRCGTPPYTQLALGRGGVQSMDDMSGDG